MTYLDRSTDLSQRLLTRRAAAQVIRVDVRRLRRYEELGLIQPAGEQAGETLYGEAELARLRRIQRLLDHCGLNLAGVEVVLRLTDELEQLSRRADAQVAELRRLLDQP